MNKKRTLIDWGMLGIVVLNAAVVIALSFGNTAKLAGALGLQPHLTAGLVEILFAALLFIRGRQRALQRNVPLFLSIGYFASLAFVTGVNMWGLSLEQPVIGPIVGLAISGSMWLMEQTLVWLWVDSHKPKVKTLRDQLKQAKEEIKQEKLCQEIEWLKFEARKPDLKLILKARKAEQKRKEILEDGGLPEFFKQYEQQMQPETVFVAREPEEQHQAQVVPMRPMQPIGFHTMQNGGEPLKHQAKTDIHQGQKPTEDQGEIYIQQAIKVAKELIAAGKVAGKDFGRNTLAKKAGVTPHYSKQALQRLKKEQA